AFFGPFQSESGKMDLRSSATCLTLGALLLCGAFLIAKPGKARPPYWQPAIWGMVCSGSTLAFAICMVFSVREKNDHSSWWLLNFIALTAVVALIAAMVCLVTGIRELVKRKTKPGGNVENTTHGEITTSESFRSGTTDTPAR